MKDEKSLSDRVKEAEEYAKTHEITTADYRRICRTDDFIGIGLAQSYLESEEPKKKPRHYC